MSIAQTGLPTIRQLPSSVVNKIAAGEVIERPASIIKELLENSVDAGSTRIDVHIEKGGIDSIQVTDNGCGIAAEQLELAIAAHATSKIQNADDLFDVNTLGFRGEALASIAEISRFTIRSKTATADSAYQIDVTGGVAQPVEPCAAPLGTTVIVEQLFYNTPVRRKFLKTTQTEMSHISEAFTRIALANPQTHMTLTHNGRVVQDLPAAAEWRDRISDFFGDEIANSMFEIASEDAGIHLHGYVVDPVHSRAHNRLQYLFLNGRHIKDRALQHALAESYRGLLLHGRHPIAFLQLEMPADRVDVNVHPCKLEVRFQDGSRLYSQLLGTIRNRFLTTDLNARQQLDNRPEAADANSPRFASESQSSLPLSNSRREIDWTSGPRSTQSPTFGSPTGGTPDAGQAWHEQVHRELDPPRQNTSLGPAMPGAFPATQHAGTADSQSAVPHDPAATGNQNQHVASVEHDALQIHNRYLVTQSHEGIVVIDQHALHERVIYEQLKEKILDGKLESQRLLVPEPVNLAPAECAAVMEAQQQLAKIGITIEPFGGDTILVQAYPAMLANHNPGEMLRNVVELLLSSSRDVDQQDIVDELLHMISCKAAVKAGDKLAPEEITALLEHRDLCQDSHHCPHGRPTSLIFSREELDKRFKRI